MKEYIFRVFSTISKAEAFMNEQVQNGYEVESFSVDSKGIVVLMKLKGEKDV
jgi:hypothetical protein